MAVSLFPIHPHCWYPHPFGQCIITGRDACMVGQVFHVAFSYCALAARYSSPKEVASSPFCQESELGGGFVPRLGGGKQPPPIVGPPLTSARRACLLHHVWHYRSHQYTNRSSLNYSPSNYCLDDIGLPYLLPPHATSQPTQPQIPAATLPHPPSRTVP